jgi:hypothetical protein
MDSIEHNSRFVALTRIPYFILTWVAQVHLTFSFKSFLAPFVELPFGFELWLSLHYTHSAALVSPCFSC